MTSIILKLVLCAIIATSALVFPVPQFGFVNTAQAAGCPVMLTLTNKTKKYVIGNVKAKTRLNANWVGHKYGVVLKPGETRHSKLKYLLVGCGVKRSTFFEYTCKDRGPKGRFTGSGTKREGFHKPRDLTFKITEC